MQDFLNVEMNDEQIMDLLVEALQDITGYDEEISKETLLIDELGLDSLGFLDLFFTIQTSIQREVTNEQMRNLILEELNLDTDPAISKLSEGEKDRVAYPQLKVENFFNIVKKQLNPELAGIDLEATSERIFDADQLDNFLKSNFEQIKQEKIAEQLEANNISDPRMQEIVRNSFEAIDPGKIQSLFADKKLMVNMVKKYLKDKMDLDNPENLQRFLMGENKNQLQVKAFLQSDAKGRSIFDMFLDQNKSNIYDLYLTDNKETMIGQILEERKSQVISELSGGDDDKNLILKIFDRRREDILQIMMSESRQEIIKNALDQKRKVFEDSFNKQKAVNDFDEFVWQNLAELTPELLQGQRQLMEEEILSKGYQLWMNENDSNFDIKAIFEEEKEALFSDIISREKSAIYKQIILNDEEKEKLMNQLVNDDKLNLFSSFVSENKISLKREVQQRGLLDENSDFATQLLANEEVQQDLMKSLIDSQIGSVFEEEVSRQSEMVEDTEVLNFLKDTFLTNEFREGKIKNALNMGNMQGDLVEEFMRNNFDRIAMEETQRLLADKDLRNQLVQDYIKENYDPMEAMQLNDPEKMKELQQKITEKYMQDNLDEIIARYMNDYMNEMMDAIPEEEIEVDGDVQEEFMKKFMARMDDETQADNSKDPDSIAERFIKVYDLTDPMIQAFVENNFDDVYEIIQRISGLKVDEEDIEQFVVTEFPLTVGLYFHSIIDDFDFNHGIRQNYTKHFVENNMDEIMEVTMQRQFEFMMSDNVQLDWEKYATELNECIKEELRSLYENIDADKVEKGINALFKGLDYDWTLFLNVLKDDFDTNQRQKILRFWLRSKTRREQIQTVYLREFLQERESEIRAYPLGQWINVMEGRSTSKALSAYYNSAFKDYLRIKFAEILRLVETSQEYIIEQEFRESLEQQCLRVFLPALFTVACNTSHSLLADYKTQFSTDSSTSLDELLNVLFPNDTNSTLLDLSKRLNRKLSSISRKFEITKTRLNDFLLSGESNYRTLAANLCKKMIAAHENIGQEQLVQIISKLSWKKQSGLIVSLLNNEISQEEILFSIMTTFLTKNQRKIEKMTDIEMYDFTEKTNYFELLQNLMKEYSDTSSKGKAESSFDINAEFADNKFPQLNTLFQTLETNKKSQMNGFFERLHNRLGLKPKMFLELTENIVSQLSDQMNQEESEMKDRLTIYASRKIMEEYDFMIMERISEKLEDNVFIAQLMHQVKHIYASRQIFRLFRTGIRSTILNTEQINWTSERATIQDISHELVDKLILKIARQTEV